MIESTIGPGKFVYYIVNYNRISEVHRLVQPLLDFTVERPAKFTVSDKETVLAVP